MVHVEPMEQFGISSRAVVIHCNLEPFWIARQRDADVALRVRLEVLALITKRRRPVYGLACGRAIRDAHGGAAK